jgi:alpha-tubulin suppressor-like RCC1 family protein/pimeloyl-ACP methyl ester carboxylesterase
MKTRQLNMFVFVAIIALLLLLASSSAPPAAAYTKPPPEAWRMDHPPAAPLASAVAIAAGLEYTCAVTTSGGAKCWGDNGRGQLGDATTTDSWTPVDVSGLTSGVRAIAAGWFHTCALTSGGVKCWGWNSYGELGDGTTSQRTTPVDVSGLTSGVSAIAAGGSHTCALTTSGGVKCWGWNGYGQLGDDTTTDRTMPVDVAGLTSGVSAIVTGDGHTCALTTSSGVKCWGRNDHGQLGDSTTSQRLAPIDVTGLTSGVSAIAAGTWHNCAVTMSGGVKCWGDNWSGQLGDGTDEDRTTPVDVTGLTSGASAIDAGSWHTCALTTSGGVKCWGWNSYGQLGDGTVTWHAAPVDVSELTSGVSAITAGYSHTCALTTSGGVKCWGDNHEGQLGDSTTTQRNTPVDVVGLSGGTTSSISGRVTDAGNNPISGVTVSDGTGHTATTDGDGNYTLSGLAAGTYTITPSKSGYTFSPTSRNVTVPPDATGQNFTGTPFTYSISGRVTDSNNNPISGVSVSDGAGHTATTDSNGYYALGGLAAGTYTVTPSKSGYTFSPASRSVTVPPNATGQNFTGTLAPGCYTLTANTQPSAGGTTTKSPAGNCNSGSGYTAGTVVKLTAVPSSGYRFSVWSGDASGTSATVNVTMTWNKSVTGNFAQASQKPAVVLVHGWGGPPFFSGNPDYCSALPDHAEPGHIPPSADGWGVFVPNLLNDNWDVWIAHLNAAPGVTPSMEENAFCLKIQLDNLTKQGIGNIVLIGHSMGGLVSRAYIENTTPYFYTGNVSKLITLGSPHTGTTGGILFCRPGIDDAACQFATNKIDNFNQSYSTRASNVAYRLLGGNLTQGILASILKQFDGDNDGAVGVYSGMGKRYTPRPFQPPLIETVIDGPDVTRYAIGADHGDYQGYPNYFHQAKNNNATLTETYRCVQQLLGISTQGCPNPTTAPVKPRTPTTSIITQASSFSGHLSTGQVVTRTVPIDTGGFSQFNLTWTTGTVGFTLKNPLGTVIDPAYAAAHPSEVVYTANTTDSSTQLFATYAFTTTVPGTYTLTITAGDVGASGTDYSAFALVDSPRVLTVTTNSTLYAVGSTATIAATLQNSGTGLTGAAVQARLYRTGVVSDTITLADQGGGNYTATYTIPNAPGYLGLSVIAQGNEAGTTYARQVDNLLAISPPTVQLTGQYADNAVDSDSNGKLDTLNLAIGVNSTQAGNYLLSGDLVGVGNVLVAHGVVSTTLTTGTITATLPFNGDDIQRSGLNGPYTLTNLTITDQQNGGVPAVWKAANVYTTSAYNFADFAATRFVLTTNATTGGTISANPSPNCNGGLQYTSGTTVTLTASPNTSYTFLNWSGDASGSSNPVTVTMNGDKTVGADFATRLYLPLILHNPVQESNPIYLPIILK